MAKSIITQDGNIVNYSNLLGGKSRAEDDFATADDEDSIAIS